MRVRSVVATVAVAAVAGLGALPLALSADASTPGHTVAAASSAAVKLPLVKGVVVDQFGTYLDDVKVQATDKKGKPVASALTYASKWESGPQHGFFFVEVGAQGTYTLTLSKSGYDTKTISGVEVTKRRLALGEITLKKTAAPTKTTAVLDSKVITSKQNGVVKVTVSANGANRPTGGVEILEGRRVVGKGTLKSTSKGVVNVGLDKLAPGSHLLVASYAGSPTLKASKSSVVTLVVKKARR